MKHTHTRTYIHTHMNTHTHTHTSNKTNPRQAVPSSSDQFYQLVRTDDDKVVGAGRGTHGAADGGADGQIVNNRRSAGEHIYISLVLLQKGNTTPHYQHVPLPGCHFLPMRSKHGQKKNNNTHMQKNTIIKKPIPLSNSLANVLNFKFKNVKLFQSAFTW